MGVNVYWEIAAKRPSEKAFLINIINKFLSVFVDFLPNFHVDFLVLEIWFSYLIPAVASKVRSKALMADKFWNKRSKNDTFVSGYSYNSKAL